MNDSLEKLSYPIGRFVPAESFNLQMVQKWIGAIATVPRLLDYCIENLDEEQLQTPYREGGWTVIQVIHHVADSHMNAYMRLKLALTEETPTIKPYDEKAWAELPDVQDVPVNVSITLIHSLHRRWVSVLQQLKEEDWLREYYHPGSDRYVPLWQMTIEYAWHGRHHVEHIMALRRRMGWS